MFKDITVDIMVTTYIHIGNCIVKHLGYTLSMGCCSSLHAYIIDKMESIESYSYMYSSKLLNSWLPLLLDLLL